MEIKLCKLTLSGKINENDNIDCEFCFNSDESSNFKIIQMLKYDKNPTINFEPVRHITEDQYQKIKNKL